MSDPGRQALIYARISQDRTGAGLGVDRQIADCRELAARLGWRIVGEHTDNDVSAYSGKPRPGYRALLADLEAGKATGVLVWHTDRLHRSPAELEGYIQTCEPRGIVTHSVQAGNVDLATASGRMVARMLGAAARAESELKSERIRRQRLQNAEAGGWHGGARPFGFEPDGITHRPEEAELIRRSVESLLAGATLRSVVREANASGLRTTFKREAWSVLAYREVLLRPRNAGLRMHQGEVIGSAQWEPIVPEEQWRAVVSILTDPSRRTSPGNRIKWLGSGLYVCGVCGQQSMVCSTSGTGKRQPSYRCRNRDGQARHASRVAEPLDRYVEDLIVARLSRPDAAELLRPATPSVDLDALRTEATAARTRLREIAEMFGAGELTVAEARIARATAQRRLEQAEGALAVGAQPSPLLGVVDSPDVGGRWTEIDLGQRRAILDALMTVTVLPVARGRMGRQPDGSYFDPDGVRVEWKTPS